MQMNANKKEEHREAFLQSAFICIYLRFVFVSLYYLGALGVLGGSISNPKKATAQSIAPPEEGQFNALVSILRIRSLFTQTAPPTMIRMSGVQPDGALARRRA